MKKIFFLFFTVTVMHAHVKDTLPFPSPTAFQSFKFTMDDCDSCGCSASGGSMGFGSLLNANYLGMRYLYQFYRTNDGLYSNSPWYDEQYNTLQVWSRLPLGKKIQVSVLVPYHFHQRQTNTGSQSMQGLGDITLLGNYRIYQNLKKDSLTVQHTFIVGGGVKMPTGVFDQANNGSVNPGYQLGTGSWDAIFLTDYTLRYRQFGVNAVMNYTNKSENSKGYRFGNQFNYAGTLYYIWNKDKMTLAPQLGVSGEVYAHNYQHGQKLKETNGSVLFSKIGFEAGIGKWSLGANVMLPLHQNLMAGNVNARSRIGINLNYAL
ncbi:transporter [Flavobacterium sp. N1719]|uniref:transporter n=1 Tax=Flavobacterium sp. N1719 TaxID=2885633 RepID=UPI002223075B|nr:transporter [Flavobacterium sp. N1719]